MQSVRKRLTAAAAALAMLAGSGTALAIPAMNTGPFIVFFEWDRTNLTPEATQVLDTMLREWASAPGACYMVVGHTDRSGSASYNLGRSQRMARSVASYLFSRGVPAAQVTTMARGETENRLPTPDGVREAQNRRVEVTVGACR